MDTARASLEAAKEEELPGKQMVAFLELMEKLKSKMELPIGEAKCSCCNRKAKDEEEKVQILAFMKDKTRNIQKKIDDDDGGALVEITEQLKILKKITNGKFQRARILEEGFGKLSHEVKKQEAEMIQAKSRFEESNEKTENFLSLLKVVNRYSTECHSLKNHQSNMKGILQQIQKCEDQMPSKQQQGVPTASSVNGTVSVDDLMTLEAVDVELESVEKKRTEIADFLVDLDRALDDGMRRQKSLQDALSAARTQKQSHTERIQTLVALNTSVQDMEARMIVLESSVKKEEKEIKNLQKDEVKCRADMEANESELERTLEDVKMKYQSCHEAYLIFEQSHGALEKNASSGSIEKLNRCDEDVENSTQEKKEIEKYISFKEPELSEMKHLISQSGRWRRRCFECCCFL
jgi:hypothetical protein